MAKAKAEADKQKELTGKAQPPGATASILRIWIRPQNVCPQSPNSARRQGSCHKPRYKRI